MPEKNHWNASLAPLYKLENHSNWVFGRFWVVRAWSDLGFPPLQHLINHELKSPTQHVLKHVCAPERLCKRAVRHEISHCCPVCQLLSLLVNLSPMVQSWLCSFHSHLINYYLPIDTFIQKHMFLHSFWLYYWRGLIVQWWQIFTMNECWCRKSWARQSRLKNGG